MTRQVIDGQMQEFLGQPDAATRLAWLKQFSTQDLNNATSSDETIEIDNIIELALALKTEATRLMRDEPEKAQRLASLTDEIAIWSKNPQVQAISDWTWGNAHFFQGHHQACLDRYQASLGYYEQADQQIEMITLHINCANVCTAMGDLEQSLKLLSYAQSVLVAESNVDIAIRLEITLIATHIQLDNYEEAIRVANHGIILAAEHDRTTEEAQLKINLAWVLEETGAFDKAIQCLEEAQKVFASDDEELEEARAWLNLGLVRARIGDYRQALLDFDAARRRFDTLGNDMEVAVTDWHRTQVYLDLNLLPEVIELYETNRTILQEYDLHYYNILTDYYTGIAYERLGELEQASQHLEQASKSVPPSTFPIQAARIDLARARAIADLSSQEIQIIRQPDIHTDVLALQRGESLAQAASEVFQTHQLPLRKLEAQIVLADIQRQRQDDADSLANAQQNYLDVLNGAHQHIGSGFHHRAYYGLGKLAELSGKPEQALAWYDQAIDVIMDTLLVLGENELRGGYLYDKLMVFQAGITLNLAEGHNEKALHLIELTRTEAWQISTIDDMELSKDSPLERSLSILNREQLETEIDHLRQQWRWYYQQLYGSALSDLPDEEEATRSDIFAQRRNKHNKKLKQIEQTLKEAIRTLRLHSQQNNGNQNLTDLTLDQLSGRLEPQQCMVVYYVLDDQIVVFLVTPQQTIPLILDTSWNEICFDLDKLDFTINNFGEKADKHLNRLWKRLFAPLLPHLENYTELIIVPHDRLYHLPFHALYNGERYLLQLYQIHCVPTITWIMQDRERAWHKSPPILQSEQSTALIMAYSDRDGPKPILGTLDEAKAIYQAWQNVAAKDEALSLMPELYLDKDARSTHIYEHAHKVHLLHLATHGEFRSDNSLFSTLLLDDGPISLADIERLHLKSKPLVALSACETGVHKVRGADVLGISQAFLQAGACMVLVSLWRVEDRATAMLMQAFHEYLITELAPAQALRQAQIDLIDDPKFSHPSYWAGWTLVG